ncbi:hypothetical protein IWQ54_003428 [Labrenzia sp. EL_195]|nr:hypothetical protein [Labrenzia sp. EL_195]
MSINFLKVVEYLDASVGGADQQVWAHGAFWRDVSRDEFVNMDPIYGVELITVGNGAGSGLIKSLRGEDPFGVDDGVEGARFRTMPSQMPAMAASRIDEISGWIDDGCPE